MEQNQELLDLLRKIEKSSKQQSRIAVIQCVLTVVTVLCCVAAVVLICRVLPQFNELVTQMQTVLGNLEQTTEQLAAADLESMVSNVDSFVITGQDSLEKTMEKLNTIDFEALNNAIKDLAAVVEPLANFFGRFS